MSTPTGKARMLARFRFIYFPVGEFQQAPGGFEFHTQAVTCEPGELSPRWWTVLGILGLLLAASFGILVFGESSEGAPLPHADNAALLITTIPQLELPSLGMSSL